MTRREGKLVETPQEVFMLVALFGFAKYSEPHRTQLVLDTYQALSTFEISLPTPTMIQLRTRFNRYFSCNIIPYGDSKTTIANAGKALYEIVASGAGVGADTIDFRGLGADIDNGRLAHTGSLPILKSIQSISKAFKQPSRDGSTTSYSVFYHKEVESYMVWGNNKGTEETRARDIDYAIVLNNLFFERYKADEDITLFFMNDVPRLAANMGNPTEFKALYEYYEASVPLAKQTKVKASKIWDLFISERFFQSRLYACFAEAMSGGSSFTVPIRTSNLCLEITVPVFPIHRAVSIKRYIAFTSEQARTEYYDLRNSLHYVAHDEHAIANIVSKMSTLHTFVESSSDFDYFDLDNYVNPSEIGVCILAGINMGQITDKRLPIVGDLLVRLLEELIDLNVYDVIETAKAATMRRTLGIGFSDVFHDLAKHKKFYNTVEGRQHIHDRVELATYSMIRSSIELAKERGSCQLVTDTKYHLGQVPMDYSSPNVASLLTTQSTLDWESLRADLKLHGIRHSTLFANAPYGSSSLVSNSTPGIEPPRDLVAVKSGITKLVPGLHTCGKYYTTAWSPDFNNTDYFKFLAVIQKFMDQSISVNQYTNLIPLGGKVPSSLLTKEILTARYYGLKTLYYLNPRTSDSSEGLVEEEESCDGGGCNV